MVKEPVNSFGLTGSCQVLLMAAVTYLALQGGTVLPIDRFMARDIVSIHIRVRYEHPT